jgi:hypothetical protein
MDCWHATQYMVAMGSRTPKACPNTQTNGCRIWTGKLAPPSISAACCIVRTLRNMWRRAASDQ